MPAKTTRAQTRKANARRVAAWRQRNPELSRARQRFYDAIYRMRRALSQIELRIADHRTE